MNQKLTIALLIAFLCAIPAFAEFEVTQMELSFPAFTFVTYFAVEDTNIPQNVRNNEFYLESLRLTKLAQDTYEFGDYEASAGFAEEAIRFALLSDEFVSSQLIVEAKRLLDWANDNNIHERFPNNYNEGKSYYETSVVYHSEEDWINSIDAAVRSIEILAAFEAGRPVPERTTTTATASASGLPRQYTVRTWIVERDCLWNIAGYPWVYGDPWKWPELYNANKSKMPDPNNPNLIEPGMVLDIPTLTGEARQGMWTPSGSSANTSAATTNTSSDNRSVPTNR